MNFARDGALCGARSSLSARGRVHGGRGSGRGRGADTIFVRQPRRPRAPSLLSLRLIYNLQHQCSETVASEADFSERSLYSKSMLDTGVKYGELSDNNFNI